MWICIYFGQEMKDVINVCDWRVNPRYPSLNYMTPTMFRYPKPKLQFMPAEANRLAPDSPL
jgi:hypothetical protein